MNSNKPKAVIYCRVSSQKQVKKGDAANMLSIRIIK